MEELEAKRAESRAAMDARDTELRANLQSDPDRIVETGYGSGTPAGGQSPESQEDQQAA